MTHNYQTAPMAKRVTAFIIDMIIVGMVTSAFLFVSMGKTPEKLQASGDEGKPSLMDKYQFFAYFEPIALDPNRGIYLENFLKKYKMESAVGLFLLPLLYFVLLEGMKGATIGKMMTGIRVRRKDGGRRCGDRSQARNRRAARSDCGCRRSAARGTQRCDAA